MLGTACMACELVILVLLGALHNPDTMAWRLAFGAVASLPGFALGISETGLLVDPRHTPVDPAPEEPAHPPPEGLLLQPSRCSLHTGDDRKL